MSAQKTFGKYREFGCSMFGATGYGAEPVVFTFWDGQKVELSGVYQKRSSAGKAITVRERFYFPRYPNTPAQLNTRQNIRLAVASWRSLTENEKMPYNKRAEGLNMSGYNLYIREYIKSL